MKPLLILCAASLLTSVPALSQEKTAPAEPKAGSVANTVQDVTPEEVERLLKEKKGTVVLDVRTGEEFKEGHIAGAKNVDFLENDFVEKISKLDPSKSYILHCASGGRSSKALEKLKAQKVSKIYHMNGGIAAWTKAGKPLEK
jgi:rhodanese-related sulfurtransferase